MLVVNESLLSPPLFVKYILPKKKLQPFVIRLFNFFWTSKCFLLFEVVRLLNLVSLLSKSVLLTKWSKIFYYSGVVICLACSGILFSASIILVVSVVAATKLLVSSILFSSSLILTFKTVVVTWSLVSGVFYQHLQFFPLNFVYLCSIGLCALK